MDVELEGVPVDEGLKTEVPDPSEEVLVMVVVDEWVLLVEDSEELLADDEERSRSLEFCCITSRFGASYFESSVITVRDTWRLDEINTRRRPKPRAFRSIFYSIEVEKRKNPLPVNSLSQSRTGPFFLSCVDRVSRLRDSVASGRGHDRFLPGYLATGNSGRQSFLVSL